MTFLWFVGPVAVVIIYLLTTSRDKRRAGEADAWAAVQRVKRVNAVPSVLSGMIEDIGAGTPVRIFEIIPKAAYLGVYEANALSGSDHQTVFLQLEEAGPACTIRPLPIVDGSPITNVGVQFGKHRAFMDNFLVEGESAAAIKRWLTRPLRKALLELTDVWVRVDGKQMAVTLYGTTYTPRPPAEEPPSGAATTVYRAASARSAAPAVVDSMRLQELVTAADALFAEYGAAGAPSLLLEDDRDDDAGGDDDAEEPAFHPPPKPEAAKPAGKPEAAKPAAAPKPASKPAPDAAAKPPAPKAEAAKSGPTKAVKVAAAVPRSPASISKSPAPSKPSKR